MSDGFHHQGYHGRLRKIVVAPASSTSLESMQTASSHSNHSRGPSGRSISRGGSLKGSALLQRADSRIFPNDSSNVPNTARSKHNDASEVSYPPDKDGSTECCNMKLSDLRIESLRHSCYNTFEIDIVDARRANRERTPGRSIKSIKNSPNASFLSSLTKFSTSSSGTLRGLTIVTDHILLGGREEAENASLLLEHGVTHVLNTAQQLPNYFPQQFVYLKLNLVDATTTNIVEVSDTVVSFLSHVENVQGRVLVHCLAGVSRSVSAVLMHLMLRHRLPLQDGFRYLRSCRPQVNPNDAFKLQLAKLEVQELKYSSVAGKDADRAWDFYDWNSIRRSMPTVRPDEDEDERYLGPEDAHSRSVGGRRGSRGGAGAGASGSGAGHQGLGYLRQLSSSSIQDTAVCCVLS